MYIFNLLDCSTKSKKTSRRQEHYFNFTGDSEDTDEIVQPTSSTSPPESDVDSPPSTSYEIPPEIPFKSYSRHNSQPRSRSSDSERPSRRGSDHGKASARGGHEDYDTKSFASQSSLSAQKQV